ncbi:MAG: hypothetical protein ACHQYP_05725 [Nitrospiria bacterium]
MLINPENKGIENAVVSFENISQGKKHDPLEISLVTFHCRFVHRILAAMIGDSYEVKNADPILHNTYLQFGTSSILSVILEPNGSPIKKPLVNDAGIIYGKCNAHKFMTANILVFSQPYFAITNKNGGFKISDIPPGSYKVKIWHEILPIQETKIKIESGHETKLSLELSFNKYKKF